MSPLKSRTKRQQADKSKQAPVIATLERLRLSTPNPRCELYYRTPYQLLVSVILSAQATDKQVNKCMEPHYRQNMTLQDILDGGEAEFLRKIRSIGLAPTKARNVLRMSHILQTQYDGQVPRTRDELESLPGVGRKTANVILGEIFAEPTLAVDTHVFRVGRRLGWHDASTPRAAEDAMLELIPKKFLPTAHHWLILLGRYTCKASNPNCDHCVVTDLCPKLLNEPRRIRSGKRLKTKSTQRPQKRR